MKSTWQWRQPANVKQTRRLFGWPLTSGAQVRRRMIDQLENCTTTPTFLAQTTTAQSQTLPKLSLMPPY